MEQETIEGSNKIKIIKNTKGYGWEITIMSHDVEELDRINELVKSKYGS